MFFQPFEDRVAQLVARELLSIDAGGCQVQAELTCELFIQAFEIPLVRAHVFSSELVEIAAKNAADVVFKNQLALFDSFKQLATKPVDGLTLFVHYVVVLKQVLARLEVLSFNGLLRTFDS